MKRTNPQPHQCQQTLARLLLTIWLPTMCNPEVTLAASSSDVAAVPTNVRTNYDALSITAQSEPLEDSTPQELPETLSQAQNLARRQIPEEKILRTQQRARRYQQAGMGTRIVDGILICGPSYLGHYPTCKLDQTYRKISNPSLLSASRYFVALAVCGSLGCLMPELPLAAIKDFIMGDKWPYRSHRSAS